MATTTTPTQDLLAQRDELIKAYEQETATSEAAKAAGDIETMKSANARKSNRSKEIRLLELEMATEGVEFTPWDKPRKSGKASTPAQSQEEIEAQMQKLLKVLNGDFAETTRETADKAITGLMAQAKRAGYSIEDPRQAKTKAKK